MPTETVRIPVGELYAFVVQVLLAVGVPKADAAIVADCLLTANLSGIDSHGVVRLAHYVRRLENGTLMPLSVKAGDRVLFGRYAGTEVELDGDKYLIMREEDVLGILE